jgi:hypothetical protein
VNQARLLRLKCKSQEFRERHLPFAFGIEKAANCGSLRMAAVHPGGPLWSLTLKSILTEIVELKRKTETMTLK